MIGRTNVGGGGGLSESDAVLLVTVPTGSSVTAAKSGKTLTPKLWVQNADNTQDTAIFSIPSSTFDANSWTVTATLNGDTASDTIVINSAKEYTMELSYRMPSAYQEVEYLQSSGSQYIDVGLNPVSTSWGFEVDVMPLNSMNSSHAIFGQKTSDSAQWNLHCWNAGSGYNGTLYMGNNYYAAKMTQNTRSQLSLHLLTFVNAASTSTTITNTTVGNLSLYLFACNKNNAVYEASSMRLYSFKLYDATDTLVADLIPCYRILDSVAGLWDTKRKTFLTNSGSGSFTVGADVT